MIGFLAAISVAAPPDISCTTASFYGHGDGFHGLTTANGEVFDAYGLTAAHKTLPFGTRLLVFTPGSNEQVVVRISDRGPYVDGRELDLSYGAFRELEDPDKGLVWVCYSEQD